MENLILCPYCKKTISNDSVLHSEAKDAGLASSYVYCGCGEMVAITTIIDQIRNQKSQQQESDTDFITLPWLKLE
jgi:hypothetical protein